MRLDSARERIARWSLQVSSTEPDTLAPKLQRAPAQVLRAATPGSAIDDILWMYASRRAAKGDTPGSRALYTELVRRSEGATGKVDWLRITSAHVKREDVLAKVDGRGLEPLRVATAEPKSAASANSATRPVDREGNDGAVNSGMQAESGSSARSEPLESYAY